MVFSNTHEMIDVSPQICKKEKRRKKMRRQKEKQISTQTLGVKEYTEAIIF